ncbi:hypothetical protein [Saezia sanguinis]|nr:hypothetical protein [Saezia sanguinis]
MYDITNSLDLKSHRGMIQQPFFMHQHSHGSTVLVRFSTIKSHNETPLSSRIFSPIFSIKTASTMPLARSLLFPANYHAPQISSQRNLMSTIPPTATTSEIALFVKSIDTPGRPVNTEYAAMAYLGMCRNQYMSHNWLICQFAWEESINNIKQSVGEATASIVKTRIEQLYQQKGYFPNSTP